MQSLKCKVKSYKRGFTLVEMLVVLLIFSIVTVLVTRSIALSMRNSRKSESIGKARENVEYVLNVMERQIRNAKKLDCVTSTATRLNYKDEDGNDAYFQCSSNSIFFTSSRLTNPSIRVDCATNVFACNVGVAGVPEYVDISINATTSDLSGAEGFTISSSTKILLRTY